MKKSKTVLYKKFADVKGESIIESLVALLICVLSMGFLVGMISGSTMLTRKADEIQNKYESTMQNVVGQIEKSGVGTITVSMKNGLSYTLPIEYYKSDGIGGVAVYSYHVQEASAP